VEIMVVTLIIGVMASIAIPSFLRARKIALRNRFISDQRVLCDGLTRLVMSTGSYPPDCQAGEIPPGLASFVKHTDWTKPTEVGGRWDWDYKTAQCEGLAGLAVDNPTWSDADMADIDGWIDDGNLETGRFRKNGRHFMYLLER
jgi:type II secretory pathway pseudopilin PulG